METLRCGQQPLLKPPALVEAPGRCLLGGRSAPAAIATAAGRALPPLLPLPCDGGHERRRGTTCVGEAAVGSAALLPFALAAGVKRRRRTAVGRRGRGLVTAAAFPHGELFSVDPLMEPSEVRDEALVVWLHGLGDTGRGWSSTAPALQRMGMPMLRFLFPTAPIRDAGTSRGPCPSWYDVPSLNPDEIARLPAPPAGLEEAASYVLDLVEPYVRRGVPPSRVFLAGYSQGGGAALAAALRAPRTIGGVLMLSSWAAEPIAPGMGPPETRVHVFHGAEDPVVPPDAARRSHDIIAGAGLRTTLRVYGGMAHSVCDQEVGDIAETLYAALN